jgi:hypothetical protein
MTARLELGVSIMRLYNGRRSLYASLTIGRRTWFISRWDSVRVLPKAYTFDIYRGPEMCWYAGTWRLSPAGEIVR